jgi:hypothetical protein
MKGLALPSPGSAEAERGVTCAHRAAPILRSVNTQVAVSGRGVCASDRGHNTRLVAVRPEWDDVRKRPRDAREWVGDRARDGCLRQPHSDSAAGRRPAETANLPASLAKTVSALQRTAGNAAVVELVSALLRRRESAPLARSIAAVSRPRSRVLQRQDPRHARGHAGEQGLAFSNYRWEDGWGAIRGPSGSEGHPTTTRGEDGLFWTSGRANCISSTTSRSRGGAESRARPQLTRNGTCCRTSRT